MELTVPVKYDPIKTTPFASILRSYNSIDECLVLQERGSSSNSASAYLLNFRNSRTYTSSTSRGHPKIIPKKIPDFRDKLPPHR